jgi:hypothetical protein
MKSNRQRASDPLAIAQSEAYGQTIRQRPRRPRFQKHPG